MEAWLRWCLAVTPATRIRSCGTTRCTDERRQLRRRRCGVVRLRADPPLERSLPLNRNALLLQHPHEHASQCGIPAVSDPMFPWLGHVADLSNGGVRVRLRG